LRGNKRGEERRDKRGWDKECREKKREVKKILRKWKRRREEGEVYRRKKREYREMCEAKRQEEKDRMIREIGKANTEAKVWKLIGRIRKRRRINEEIKMEEWKEYFMELMGGMDGRVIRGDGGTKMQGEEEIEVNEIRNAIGRLEIGKAIGSDGIPNEAWKYGGEEMEKWEVWETCKRVWRGEE